MKRLAILSALILGLVLATAWADDEAAQPAPEAAATTETTPATTEGETTPPADPAAQAALEMMMGGNVPEVSEADISYALGFIVGNDMKGQGIKKVDTAQFAEGLNAGLGNVESRLTPMQINMAMNAFVAKIQQQAADNEKAGVEFLAENAKKEGVTTTESGLQIKTIKEGDGEQVKAGDVVTVNYEGRLIDGTVFDKSQPEQPMVWDPRRFTVIDGWVEGLPLMKKGGQYELYIPSELAYGNRPMGDIPPSSVLVFTIDVVDTQTPPAPAAGEAGVAVPPME